MNVGTLAEFRRWATSDEFPEQGRIDFIAGQIEVDMSPEDIFMHGTVKTSLVGALYSRVSSLEMGVLLSDSTRVSCPDADLSVEPDIVFVSQESLATGRIRPVPKAGAEPDRYVELEGPPDLIVEIVSDSSVAKDTQRLLERYYAAGVTEYWLVDARRDPTVFRIHRRRRDRFEPVEPDAEGFQRSDVLGCSCHLARTRDRHGRIKHVLSER